MHPKVSIVLPIYNGEKTLLRTLDSLLEQTYTNFELIACIDGTSDGSEGILRNKNDPRIKILKNSVNMGLGRTLNRLISHSDPHAPYIAIAEQDDWYFPYRLEKQVDFLERNTDYGLVSGIAYHYNEDRATARIPGMLEKGLQYPEELKEMFLLNFRKKIKVQQTCMMFRRNIHIENGFYFSQHFHTIPIDWLYILRFSLVSKIYGLNMPLVKKDRTTDRTSATSSLKRVHRGDRELIRSSYWEFSKILSKKDYKYAMNTQIFAEGKNQRVPVFIYKFFEALLNDPFDTRFKEYLGHLGKRIKSRLR